MIIHTVINSDRSIINQCHACQVVTPPPSKSELTKMTPMPHAVFHTLAIDIKEPLPTNQFFLVLVDYHSRYPFVELLPSTSTSIIKCLDQLFSMFKYPNQIISDNHPGVIARGFCNYLKSHCIMQKT